MLGRKIFSTYYITKLWDFKLSHYGELYVLCWSDADYKVVLLNSYQTAKYRDFSTLKKIKNGYIDAYVIVQLLASRKYKASYISNKDYHNLKVLNRLKKSLDDKIKSIQREISTVIATVNPEIEKVFPNI